MLLLNVLLTVTLVTFACSSVCRAEELSKDQLVQRSSTSRKEQFMALVKNGHVTGSDCGKKNIVISNDPKEIFPAKVPTNDRNMPHTGSRIISNDRAVSVGQEDTRSDRRPGGQQPHTVGRVVSNDRAVPGEREASPSHEGPSAGRTPAPPVSPSAQPQGPPRSTAAPAAVTQETPRPGGRIVSNDRAASPEQETPFDKGPSTATADPASPARPGDPPREPSTNDTATPPVATDESLPPWDDESMWETNKIVCVVVVFGLVFLGVFWCYNKHDDASLARRREDMARARDRVERVPLASHAASGDGAAGEKAASLPEEETTL